MSLMKQNEHIGMVKCSFCDGSFSAGNNPPTVTHTLPPCAKWVLLEPEEFLRECRLAREGKEALS